MTTSMPQVRHKRPARPWFRSFHRWLGGIAVLFVLLLALTGIALNHGHDWRLDQRHVTWGWLLDAYGIDAPRPSDSFGTPGHRATLIGERLYFDESEIADGVETLSGLVALDEMLVLTTADAAALLTPEGELVEWLELALPGPVQRLGVKDDRAVILSQGAYFFADEEVTGFLNNPAESGTGIDWSDGTPAPASLIETLQTNYRGAGLTVERVLADSHSGRILGPVGVWFMDFIAICLIVLSVTGLFQWRRSGRRNGNGSR